jgi:hypothetical protein
MALAVLVTPAADRRRGVCVVCGGPLIGGDPFLRNRGEYYHAHNCLESNPPASPWHTLAARKAS